MSNYRWTKHCIQYSCTCKIYVRIFRWSVFACSQKNLNCANFHITKFLRLHMEMLVSQKIPPSFYIYIQHSTCQQLNGFWWDWRHELITGKPLYRDRLWSRRGLVALEGFAVFINESFWLPNLIVAFCFRQSKLITGNVCSKAFSKTYEEHGQRYNDVSILKLNFKYPIVPSSNKTGSNPYSCCFDRSQFSSVSLNHILGFQRNFLFQVIQQCLALTWWGNFA